MSRQGKASIIEDLYESKIVHSITRKVLMNNNPTDEKYLDDLTQDVFFILFKQKDELLNTLKDSNKFAFYVSSIVVRQIKSSTSPFHRKYRREMNIKKQYFKRVNLNHREEKYTEFDVLEYCDKNGILNKDEREILIKYFKLEDNKSIDKKITYRELAKTLNIGHCMCWVIIKEAVEKIKTHTKLNGVKFYENKNIPFYEIDDEKHLDSENNYYDIWNKIENRVHEMQKL